jgi:hypothetical protein
VQRFFYAYACLVLASRRKSVNDGKEMGLISLFKPLNSLLAWKPYIFFLQGNKFLRFVAAYNEFLEPIL